MGLAEQRLAQVLAHHRLDRSPEQRGERSVRPAHAALLVHDRHPLAQRVERRLPLLLRLAHEIEETGVGEHHGGVRGERGEQPDVLGREAAPARIGDEQRPHRHAVGVQRHGGGGVGLDLREQAGGSAAGVADQLELLSGERAGQQARVGAGDGVILELGERAHRGRHPQRRVRARARRRQREQGAAGLQEPQCEAHHLVRDPLQLERVGEDVGQLLQGEQLREPAVELLGGAVALALAAQQPRRHVPEQAEDARESDGDEQPEERGRARGYGSGWGRDCARASTRARSRSNARIAPRLQESLVRPW